MKRAGFASAGFASAMIGAIALLSSPHGMAETAAKKEIAGKWLTAAGEPTYNIANDGAVDWYTFSGFRRYHSDCHACHGPDGEGSSYAPALKDSLKTMSYGEFSAVVAGGRRNVTTSQENVMPAFGTNKNVACYMDDIFVYLRARANDAWGRMRPSEREPKSDAYTRAEDACTKS